jgi:hypothetical protein
MLFYYNRANITKTNQLLKIQFILFRRPLYCPRWLALFNPVQYITLGHKKGFLCGFCFSAGCFAFLRLFFRFLRSLLQEALL